MLFFILDRSGFVVAVTMENSESTCLSCRKENIPYSGAIRDSMNVCVCDYDLLECISVCVFAQVDKMNLLEGCVW